MGLIPNGGEDGYELSCAQYAQRYEFISLENTSHRESKEFIKLCN